MSTAIQKHEKGILSFFNFYTLAAILIFTLLASYLIVFMEGDTTGMYTLGLLAVIQTLPFVICFTRRSYNYVAFVLMGHFCSYTYPKYNSIQSVNGIKQFFPETVIAIREIIYCTLIILIAYHFFRSLFFFRFSEKEKFQFLTVKKWQLWAIVIYVYSFPLISDSMPSALAAFHFVSYNADLILLFSVTCPEAPKLTTFGKLGAYLSALFYFVSIGSLGMFVNLSALSFVVIILRRQYKQLISLVLMVFVVAYLQTIKGAFRALTWGTNTSKSSIDKITDLYEVIELDLNGMMEIQEIPNINIKDNDDSTEKLAQTRFSKGLDRLSDESLERVMTYTPPVVPFWKGESYSSIPFIFIPRPLWPDKPTRHFWNKFGRNYGFLDEEDYATSVAISFLAEGYMNFGYTGLYGVALFFGLLTVIVERLGYYILRGYFYFGFIVFLVPLIQYSTDLGSIIHPLVLFGMVLILFRPILLQMAKRDEYC